MEESKKIKRIMKKLDTRYEAAENMPLARARIMKRAEKLQNRLDTLKGR